MKLDNIQCLETTPPRLILAVSTRRAPSCPLALHWHRHAFHELGLLLSGEADWRLGRTRRVSLKAGDAILLKPGAFHCEQVMQGKRAHFAWLGFECPGFAPGWMHRAVALGEDFAEIGATFQAIYREHHREGRLSRLRVQLALQTVLLLVARQADRERNHANAGLSSLNARQRHCVESAAAYFRENLRQPLGVAQIAAYHSLSSAHFSKLFHRHHGKAPRAYLQEMRLRKAKELLSDVELSIKEIAQQCGFVDSAHFCKALKAESGMTPKHFRERNGTRVEDN